MQHGDGRRFGQRRTGHGRIGQDTGQHGPSGTNTAVLSNAGRNSAGPGQVADTDPRDRAATDMPDPRKLAQDWITLWQSELSAMAADPRDPRVLADHHGAMGRHHVRPCCAACRPPDGTDMTARTDAPGPLMRRGPRPLLLHLTLAMLRSTVSRATSPLWNNGWPNSPAGSKRRPSGSSLPAILQAIQNAIQTSAGRKPRR